MVIKKGRRGKMKTYTIKISDIFSPTPKGRVHPDDGPNTGQRFREQFLEPIFNDYEKIIIDLDDLYGCPSSFREEAFGGLVRKLKVKPQVVLNKLSFISTDEPPLIDEIIKDIKGAND